MFKRLTKGGGYVIIYSTIEDRSYGSGLKSKKSIEPPSNPLNARRRSMGLNKEDGKRR